MFASLSLAATAEAPGGAATPRNRHCTAAQLALHPFADQSPFNQPIPANPVLDPNSAVMVEGLASAAQHSFVLAMRRWTVPVYFSDRATIRQNIALTASWAPRHVLKNVPVPARAEADPAADGHMVIVDLSACREYDFYQARKLPDMTWQAGWARSYGLRGMGFDHSSPSARASGFALLAGLVRPTELARGRIEHALVFSYPSVAARPAVWPATQGHGDSKDPGALPYGAHVQLDPGLDVDALPLAPYERTIARALQVYGMYLGDAGGGLSLYASNPRAFRRNPYPSLPLNDYVSLAGIPASAFRVLAPSQALQR